MTYPLPGVIVDPNGQSTSITITSKTSGQTPTVYSDNAGQNVVSMPKTISAPYTFYLPNPGTWTVGGVDVTLSDDEVATVNLNTTSNGANASPTVVAGGNLGASYTLNLTTVETWLTGTLTANCAMTISGLAAGYGAALLLTQDATGGRTLTVNGASVPLNSTAADSTVVSVYTPDGSTVYITAPTSGQTIASIGGAGVTTLGSQINTLDASNNPRVILDDGSGNINLLSASPSIGLDNNNFKIHIGPGNLLELTGLSGLLLDGNSFLNGQFRMNNGPQSLAGTTAGTISYYQPFGIELGMFFAYANGYENTTGTAQTITFPLPFAHAPLILANGGLSGVTATTTTLTLPVSMGAPVTGQMLIIGM